MHTHAYTHTEIEIVKPTLSELRPEVHRVELTLVWLEQSASRGETTASKRAAALTTENRVGLIILQRVFYTTSGSIKKYHMA